RSSKPHSKVLRRLKLSFDKANTIFWKNIMMIESSRTAMFHQLSHRRKGAIVNRIPLQIFPNLIQSFKPWKKLHVLNLRKISSKHLIKMMMGIHKAGIEYFIFSINHFI